MKQNVQLLVLSASLWQEPVIRDVSCDFVDRINIVSNATIHEFTRKYTKVPSGLWELWLRPKVALRPLWKGGPDKTLNIETVAIDFYDPDRIEVLRSITSIT